MNEPNQTPTLAERLRASCECNLDSSPCGAEEMCLLDREAANEIDRLTAALSDTEYFGEFARPDIRDEPKP